MNSKFKPIWDTFLKERKLPDKCTGVIKLDYKDLKNLCINHDNSKAEILVDELLNGKVQVLN